MKVYNEIDDLEHFDAWSGAEATQRRICDAGKGEEFMLMIEELYPEGISETGLNDILRFDSERCFELVGIELEEENN